MFARELIDNFCYQMFFFYVVRTSPLVRFSLNRNLYVQGSNGKTENVPMGRHEFIELVRFGWIISGLLKSFITIIK